MKVILRILLGVLLAVLLAVWTIARVGDKAAMLAAFGEALARPGWLLLGIVLLGVSLAAGTVRWWLLLRDFCSCLRLPCC